MPLFDLPEPPDYLLTRAPLAQALAQVRFPLIASFQSITGIAPLQEELRAIFPYMRQERVQELSFTVGPEGAEAGPAADSVTWNMTNDDGFLAVVGAGSATLSAGDAYSGVEDFADLFRSLLTALYTVGHIPRCDRLGVRYLSIAEDLPGEPGTWRNWFEDSVIGWTGSSVVPNGALASSITQTRLTQPPVGDLAGPPSDVQAAITHGYVPTGTLVPGIPPVRVDQPSYLFDLDVFVEGHQSFNVKSLVDQFIMLHSQVDRFFHWSLSDDGKEHFGLEVRQ